MHVLHDQQQRTLPGLPREEVRQGGKEAALLLLWVQWEQRGKARQLRKQGDALGEQGREGTSERTNCRDDLSRREESEAGAQEVAQGGVGRGEVGGEAFAFGS